MVAISVREGMQLMGRDIWEASEIQLMLSLDGN